MNSGLVALALTACSYTRPSDVPNGGPGDGNTTFHDAREETTADAAPPCTVAPVFMATMLGQQFAQVIQEDTEEVFTGSLDGVNDFLTIELYAGRSPFATVPTPGTYNLFSTDIDTCGVCVMVWEKLNTSTLKATNYFLATSGKLELDAVPDFESGVGMFTGKLDIATFVRIKKDASGDPAVGNDASCMTAVEGVSFTATAN